MADPSRSAPPASGVELGGAFDSEAVEDEAPRRMSAGTPPSRLRSAPEPLVVVEHAYPVDLARGVLERWPADVPLGVGADELEIVLSVAYQASLMQEEGRPVRCRLLVASRSADADGADPVEALHRLELAPHRPFDEHELRRLTPAAPFETSLVGVEALDDRTFRIWGILHSGASWLAPSWGGRRRGSRHGPHLVVHVNAPGNLAVYVGERFVAALERGIVLGLSTDVFDSKWMPLRFAQVRSEVRDVHDAGAPPGARWPRVDDDLVRLVSQHLVRRVISLMREDRHGGMLLFVDAEEVGLIESGQGLIRLKYRFADGEPRRRYRTLLGRLLACLAERHGEAELVTWQHFQTTDGPAFDRAEAAIFELSRLIAGLTRVDGAVVVTKRFEIVGFGGEVSAEAVVPVRVWHAIDLEGQRRHFDFAESVGTRHRAAYRFAAAYPTGLAIVVSQDGGVRFVASLDDGVTYWEQHLPG